MISIQEKIRKIEEYIEKQAYWCETGRAYSRRAEPSLHAIMFENRVLTLYRIKDLKEFLTVLKAQIAEIEFRHQFRGCMVVFGCPSIVYEEAKKDISASLDRMIKTLQIC